MGFNVAPFAGAWIEIQPMKGKTDEEMSLPSRERGLKSSLCRCLLESGPVAPFAGAWIEMGQSRPD